MRYLGCAYYPEYWGEDRVETDAVLMRDAGINLIRIGEFAWSRMEPEEGRYDLEWLHGCVKVMAAHGIQTMMCTPTAAPPAWLTSAYPDALLTRPDGRAVLHGTRRHYCPSSDTFRRCSARITEVLSREMRQHHSVVAWQLDNEFGPELCMCHCENCHARFQAWLKERYGSLAELNRRWGTGFWSMDYTDWRQIRLSEDGSHAPSRILDSKRFWSDVTLELAFEQARIIRSKHPGVTVTTNGMGPIFRWLDYYRLFGELDVASDDLYFDIATMDADVAAMNVFRSMKPGRPFWVTETGSGALDHNRPPHPEQLKAWAWSALAHGAEAYMIFRWRTCLSGGEQELQGILEHSGKPRHRYHAVQAMFQELRRLWPVLEGLPLPSAPVAIVQDYQTLWTYQAARVGADVRYLERIYDMHKDLWRRNITADFVPPDRPLGGARDGYRLVILPSTVVISPELASSLRSFVEGGGVLLAVGQIGMRDECASYLPAAGPDHLQGLLGVEIEGGMYLGSRVAPDEAIWFPEHRGRNVEVGMAGVLGGKRVQGKAGGWIGDLTLRGGTALLEFTEDAYRDQPAVVEKRTGKGRALAVATLWGRDPVYGSILSHALGAAGVSDGPESPEYVEVVERGDVVFVINHTAEATRVRLDGSHTALLGSLEQEEAVLGPYGVCVARG